MEINYVLLVHERTLVKQWIKIVDVFQLYKTKLKLQSYKPASGGRDEKCVHNFKRNAKWEWITWEL
jgi:hypothetical protein